MATFCIVVAPLPYAVRKRLFTFLSESAIIAKVAYGLKIAFMYVLSMSCLPEIVDDRGYFLQICRDIIRRRAAKNVPRNSRGRIGQVWSWLS